MDREWGPWVNGQRIDESLQWKVTKVRKQIIGTAHGGVEGNNQSEKVVSWIKFVNQSMTWDECKTHCEALGGILFWIVDGTIGQLEFLLGKMEQKSFWLGIYTEDHAVWKSVTGEIMGEELLFWLSGQPNNYKGNQYHVVVDPPLPGTSSFGLGDYTKTGRRRCLCDML